MQTQVRFIILLFVYYSPQFNEALHNEPNEHNPMKYLSPILTSNVESYLVLRPALSYKVLLMGGSASCHSSALSHVYKCELQFSGVLILVSTGH